jgi:hypothetical protein
LVLLGGLLYISDDDPRMYSGNSPSVYQPKSNYANIESIQSAYSDSSPVPQEAPIYAKPNIRGSSSEIYNRPPSNTNSPSYVSTGSPDQFQYQRQSDQSPPHQKNKPTESIRCWHNYFLVDTQMGNFQNTISVVRLFEMHCL